jgi:hypothetical protein
MSTEAKMRREEILDNLAQCHGSSEIYEHRTVGNIKIHLTDGCAFLREAAECRWLFDIIVSIKTILDKHDTFHVITLTVNEDRTATFVACSDIHKGQPVGEIYRQEIEYTNFPLDSIKFFFADGICMLPSEY